MKKIIFTLLISVMSLQIFNSSVITSASTLNNMTTEIDTGCYWETVIQDVPLESLILPLTADKTITKTKTSTYRNAKGVALWAVSITATFSYNGTTSKCISCQDNAVATHSNGKRSEDYSETVIIKCSKDGIIS